MAPSRFEIVSGDDFAQVVTLKKDAATFSIDSSATVRCALVTGDHSVRVVGDAVSIEGPSTDWSASKILVSFTSAETAAAKGYFNQPLLLEIQVDDGGKTTWFLPGYSLVRGHVA